MKNNDKRIAILQNVINNRITISNMTQYEMNRKRSGKKKVASKV